MILGINLPKRGCFVGLVQRFVGFSSLLQGFTLVFIKLWQNLKLLLKLVPIGF